MDKRGRLWYHLGGGDERGKKGQVGIEEEERREGGREEKRKRGMILERHEDKQGRFRHCTKTNDTQTRR